MRACFADNAEVPLNCAHDISEPWNCSEAAMGIPRDNCQHWQPDLAVKLALEILGVAVKSP